MNSYLQMIQAVTTKYDSEIKKSSSQFCDYFGISQFWYNKIDDSGTLASISNSPEWTEYFAEEKLFQKCPLLRHSPALSEGVTFYPNIDVESFLDTDIVRSFYGATSYFEMGWFVITNKVKNGSEQLGLLVREQAFSSIINELSLIRAFIKQLPKRIKPVFSKLESEKIDLIEILGNSFYENPSAPDPKRPSQREKILQELCLVDAERLNVKETLILNLVLHGYSAREIAPKVFLAKRTVEHALERIKEKLECNSKGQLIQKGREMEDLGFFKAGSS